MFTEHLERRPEVEGQQHPPRGDLFTEAVQGALVVTRSFLMRHSALRVTRRREQQVHGLVAVQLLERATGVAGQLHRKRRVLRNRRAPQRPYGGRVQSAYARRVQTAVQRLAHEVMLEERLPGAFARHQLGVRGLGQPPAHLFGRCGHHARQRVGAEPPPQHGRGTQALRHGVVQQAQPLLEGGVQARRHPAHFMTARPQARRLLDEEGIAARPTQHLAHESAVRRAPHRTAHQFGDVGGPESRQSELRGPGLQ
ncbi:hypothetical protein [Streptomyces sp. KN37]|uniref:hypothetical protein n=1 Tax=Streptomyces sp. KN37 TaxID=3090667 RepID=UPI002A749292|nr:hypothetical protein [Streptomyces sp. KN37]WPO76803.1 hypothetical protein R9806_38400 [Streptomyces sp. KN37]